MTFHLYPELTCNLTYAMASRGLCRDFNYKDLADGSVRFVPYKRVQCIEIEIQAPDQWEPRAFTMVQPKARDLVRFLSQVDVLSNIDTYSLETGPSWSTFWDDGKVPIWI